MTNNANHCCKDVFYEMSQKVFLNRRNIKIKRLCLKLNNKNIGSYKILQKVETAYWLELSAFIKIHSVFHVIHLWAAVTDPLSEQINALLELVIVDNQDEWVIDEIIDSHYININHCL